MRDRVRALAVAVALASGLGLVGAQVAAAVTPAGDGGVSSGVLASGTAAATVDGLRVRSGPGTGSAVLGQVYAGDPVEILGSAHDATGQQWDLVMLVRDSRGGLPGGYVGWATTQYLYAG